MSSEVRPPAPELPAEPEVLSFGPRPSRPLPRLSRRTRLSLLLVVLALALGFGVWRLLPRPRPDFTLSDLQGIYSGMVRSDGTNDVSTVTPDRLTEPPVVVAPAECTALFEATLSNQFPADALDGVSTYWLNESSATISLVTYRYPDPDTAGRQFEAIAAALDRCHGADLTVDHRPGTTVDTQQVAAPATVDHYVSYQVSTGPDSSTRFSTDVAQLDNTVTWQYRYDYRSRANYSPAAAQQLMASLVSQMRYVQDSHR
jgi:hypothetical protein